MVRRDIVLGTIGVLLLGVMTVPWLEQHVLVTDPVATDVRLVRVEATLHGDETQLTTFRYVVRLPDGGEGRFVSETTYRVGTRLRAAVWRSRISGRVFVSGPYTALPD